jgi:hypothetical protein
MIYTKPEVTGLGEAAVVIESTVYPKRGPYMEAPGRYKDVTPAYDLDE